MRYFINLILLCFLVSVYACAVQKSPLGGPKDEDPPVIDTIKSTPNFQTNFKEEEIKLYFDEFVQLKNVFEQVVYSPPMKIKPEILQRGKKIILTFSSEDTLKSETTYTINFGDAIQDFNESNILANFRFVFSTGDIIDSLEISGNVLDDGTKEPASEVLVFLYDVLSDSIIYKEQPYYFAKTDKSGNFKIQNLRSDTFKLITLEDQNLNLKFDEGEKMGFLDSFIIVNDTLPGKLSLNIFEPIPVLNYIDDVNEPFRLKIEFNREPYDLEIRNFLDSVWYSTEIRKDSIILWHTNEIEMDSLFMFQNGVLMDTIIYKKKDSSQTASYNRLIRKNIGTRNILKPGDIPEFELSFPIISIDTTLISLQDSLDVKDYSIYVDSMNARLLKIEYDFKFGDTLTLEILPGALGSLNGAQMDTIKQIIVPNNPENYGTIFLEVDSLQKEKKYILQFLDGERILSEENISSLEKVDFSYFNMDPKSFTVKIIQDDNNNGRWDPGNYKQKVQSEIWKVFNLEPLRENWELEAKISWKD